jgi:cell wall-associated NlpC family hydrolase
MGKKALFGFSLLLLVTLCEAADLKAFYAAATVSPPAPQADRFADKGQELILHALAFIGVSYKWGGSNPVTGLDCSGFVSYVFREAAGVVLPHNAYSLSLQGKSVVSTELRPGDLVFFNTVRRAFSHVGIYIGDNRFVHAPKKGKSIQIVSLGDPYWARRYNGARRIVEAHAQ